MADSVVYSISQTLNMPKADAIPYELRFYSNKVEYVGISPLDKHVNVLTSINFDDVKNVMYKRDWNNFFLKYALFVKTNDGKTKKLGLVSGLTLEEVKKAKSVIDQHSS